MVKVLYIGKFQPFHLGHKHAVNLISEISDELIIGLGSPADNRFFKLEERLKMIFENTTATPRLLEDLQADHPLYWDWGKYVLDLCGKVDIVATGNETVKRDFVQHDIPVLWIPRYGNISGSQIREKILTGDESWEKLVPESSRIIIKNSDFYQTRFLKS